MMSEISNMFRAMSGQFSESALFSGNSMGGGQMYKRTVVEKYRPGPNGDPQLERYEDKVAKAFGNGHRVTERQQLYQNSAGYQKAGHERMLDRRGQKVVCEKLGYEERYKKYFRNLEECTVAASVAKADEFDREWQGAAKSLGFKHNTVGYSLPHRGNYRLENVALSPRAINDVRGQAQSYARGGGRGRAQAGRTLALPSSQPRQNWCVW